MFTELFRVWPYIKKTALVFKKKNMTMTFSWKNTPVSRCYTLITCVLIQIWKPQHESSCWGPRVNNTHAWKLLSSRGHRDWSLLRMNSCGFETNQTRVRQNKKCSGFFVLLSSLWKQTTATPRANLNRLGRKPVLDLVSAPLTHRL